MARGKDAPAITGGQIDPFVASTMQQNKQAAENRLLTAMQEKGATQRAEIGSATQLKTQQMRGEQDVQAQAGQAVADDKRSAEAERSRREDQKFAETTQKAEQVFAAKQAELTREHGVAMVKGDRDYAEKIMEKQESLRRFEIEKQTAAQERSTNAILSVIKGGINRESTKEKAITTLNQEADKFDQDKEIYTRTKSRVIESVGTDKRLDLPIGGTVVMKGRQIGPSMGFGAGFGQIPTVDPASKADPMGVLQDQIDKQGVKISVEHLAPENINQLEDGIQNGSIPPEDIRSTLGVLEGMKDVLEQKRKDNPIGTDEAAYDFWNKSYHDVINMRNAVEGLTKSQKKIGDSDKETVGSRVQYALGVIRNTSLGGQASRLRELTQGDFVAVFDEMTKSLQVPAQWPIDPTMSDYEKEIRQEENDMLSRVYPDLGGIE